VLTESEWTVARAARLLGVPQHRVIYLFEKGIVIPDFADAKGRGSSRRLSARNILELAIALRVRSLGLTASITAAVLYTLRGLEQRLSKELERFELVTSLRTRDDIDLRAVVSDDTRLFFVLITKTKAPRVFGGEKVTAKRNAGHRPALRGLPDIRRALPGVLGPEGSKYIRLDINVSRIARDLKLTR
jgi:DNA-binding transcriptional MerR regulator